MLLRRARRSATAALCAAPARGRRAAGRPRRARGAAARAAHLRRARAGQGGRAGRPRLLHDVLVDGVQHGEAVRRDPEVVAPDHVVELRDVGQAQAGQQVRGAAQHRVQCGALQRVQVLRGGPP